MDPDMDEAIIVTGRNKKTRKWILRFRTSQSKK
jgi:hypothetical protein